MRRRGQLVLALLLAIGAVLCMRPTPGRVESTEHDPDDPQEALRVCEGFVRAAERELAAAPRTPLEPGASVLDADLRSADEAHVYVADARGVAVVFLGDPGPREELLAWAREKERRHARRAPERDIVVSLQPADGLRLAVMPVPEAEGVLCWFTSTRGSDDELVATYGSSSVVHTCRAEQPGRTPVWTFVGVPPELHESWQLTLERVTLEPLASITVEPR